MLKFGKVAVLPALLSATVAATAFGQAGANSCDVDEGTPSSLAMATLSLSQAQSAGTPADVVKSLQNAVARLFPEGDPSKAAAENAKNPAGRAFILGKIYMIFLSQPDQPVVTTRGKLGFKSNPTGLADLSIGIDSAFSVVEKANPNCVQLISQWRQQGGWVKLVQQAMDYVNSGKVDSADVVAQEALRISPTAPYTHLVLGNVAAARNKNMDAVMRYKGALAEAAKDTVFSEVRRTILYTLGNFAADAADVDTVKADKTVLLKEAKLAFDSLALDPGKLYADAARQGRTRVLQALGDTASIRSACQEQVDAPEKFNFLTLVQCGTILAQINDYANAKKLFLTANGMNPYHRDGLFNLALMMINTKEFDKAIPIIDRLVSIDPSNPENYKLYVFAYNGIRNGYLAQSKALGEAVNAVPNVKAADQAKRKALTDSALKLDAPQRAALDKIVSWNTKADSMPVQVRFTEFTPGPEKTTISGTIFNRSTTEKSYVLNLEFLDKDGKVVSNGKATVDKVAPNGVGSFSVTATAPGIIAFRYAPLS